VLWLDVTADLFSAWLFADVVWLVCVLPLDGEDLVELFEVGFAVEPTAWFAVLVTVLTTELTGLAGGSLLVV
jgi:hypothetical protein